MGKSALEIQMDYNNAVRQANSLEETADRLKRIANKEFQDCISDISRNWTGENASAYLRKCNALKQDIGATADKLERTARSIKKMAKNTYDAEMKALRLAMVRKY